MARVEEQTHRNFTETAIRSAEVLITGLALFGALSVGVNFAEGDSEQVQHYAGSAVIWSLIAGGVIYAAEKHFRAANPKTIKIPEVFSQLDRPRR